MTAVKKNNEKHSTKYLNLTDFERLESHVESEGDLLIKKLSLKQTDKHLTLEKHLSQERDFITSHEYISITEITKGEIALPEFCTKVNEASSNQLNSNTNQKPSVKVSDCLSRHERELALCVKPNSTETKLLAFALSCEANEIPKLNNILPIDHPINHLDQIHDEQFSHLNASPIKTSKMIRRKRKQLLQSYKKPIEIPEKPIKHYSNPKSLWDLKDCTSNSDLKLYTCEASKRTEQCIGVLEIANEENKVNNFSSSINGQRFVANCTQVPINNYTKMSKDKLKTLSYFQNYQKGIPSKILYVKNIAKSVCEKQLISVFGKYKQLQNSDIVYRYMKKGKMKGQAFIEFENIEVAEKALEENLGLILEEKPLIIEFGKK
ncbi:nucleolin-like [Melanaphis sacchari]|uniref:nucleolin-like n=1 Tax=Melanaphis sacchari TaxID=742174 RepID=UPI000DC14DD3|nr:nucleolin-like [Melanaphis sacchari]XP_025192444.1 nucleolin-like [Melanaphis sacchari]XP_025192445.1 nucleolin-like [Melanaphis sacchari]XP_025192446.1 nucleolin-like [Melanaphis sacchari]XP_025192447.1 nucleolin-like [Melanaphis sacchari]XP_025192448.1 nucleolin-like [Melanaphis sacchari]